MEEAIRQAHSIILENRKKFTLAGIKDVAAFDEETVMLETVLGRLAIKGTGLHILSFNNETGDLTGEGSVQALIYTSDEKQGGFFANLFR